MSVLAGQAALVTGGSTQTGAAIAEALARAGVGVCLSGKTPDTIALAAGRILAAGGRCEAVCSQLDTLEEAEALERQTRSVFGRLDILVLATGFWGGAAVHAHPLKTWDLVLAANLREPFLAARAVLPGLRAQHSGQILAVGSDSGLGIYPNEGAFSVAMHALNTLIELIRVENADQGIRAHMLNPGLAVSPYPGQPAALTPADVAEWALFLLSRPGHLRGSGPLLV